MHFTEAALPSAGTRKVFLPGSFSNLDREHLLGYLEGKPTAAWDLPDAVLRASPHTRPRSASGITS